MKFIYKRINDKGLSLVELIVVVAIMTILTGAAGFGISLISGKPAQAAANKWTAKLERIRTVGMGKNEATVGLEYRSDGIYLTESVNGSAGETNKACGANVDCTMTIGSGDDLNVSGHSIIVIFSRSDGSVKSILVDGVENYSKCNDVKFVFKKAKVTYEVHIVPATGRVVCYKV